MNLLRRMSPSPRPKNVSLSGGHYGYLSPSWRIREVITSDKGAVLSLFALPSE